MLPVCDKVMHFLWARPLALFLFITISNKTWPPCFSQPIDLFALYSPVRFDLFQLQMQSVFVFVLISDRRFKAAFFDFLSN